MKKTITKLIITLTLLASTASLSHAYIHPEGKNYIAVKGNIGWAHNQDYTYRMPPMVNKPLNFSYNFGYAEGLAFGSYLPNEVRVEIEAMHRRYDHREEGKCPFHQNDLGHSTIVSLMGNVFWDLPSPVFEDMAFYIGAGAGPAWSYIETKHGKSTMSDSEIVFAFQAMPGISYQINEYITTFLGYKFFACTTHKKFESTSRFTHIIDIDDPLFFTQNIELGLRFTF